MQKTIFITGASTGLGKAAAQLFHDKGWKVIATMRNPEKETGLSALDNITLLPLDVTNQAQIDNAVQAAISQGVDVVFNNAGYGLMGPLEAISDEQLLRQIDTNLLGVIRVTRAFIPYFREKQSGLFIVTTSIGGLVAFPIASAYHATKWGIEGWAESMAYELNNFGIGIKTVSPGGIQTDFMSRSLDFTNLPPYEDFAQRMMTNSGAHMAQNSSTPLQIAEVVYEAATDGKKQLRYIAGADAQALYAQRQEMGVETFREHLGKMFLG